VNHATNFKLLYCGSDLSKVWIDKVIVVSSKDKNMDPAVNGLELSAYFT
jgi:hypothetical protein